MYLIFDFDGTLVDSFVCVIEKFNVLADEFNFRRVCSEELHFLRDLTSKELLHYLKIPMYKIPSVLYKARSYFKDKIDTLAPFDTIPQILHTLYKEGFSLGILTSNSEKNVINWLECHSIRQFFNFIAIESNYLGKKRVLKKILKANNINKQDAFYIGDETRDIEAARSCEVHSVAVTWGFNSEKVLLRCQPHYVARKPSDILKIGLAFRSRLLPDFLQ